MRERQGMMNEEKKDELNHSNGENKGMETQDGFKDKNDKAGDDEENVRVNITRLDEEGISKFRKALDRSDYKTINEIYERYKPIDFARAMEQLDDEEILRICALFSDEQLGEVVEQADEDIQSEVISDLNDRRVLKIFKFMQKDNVTDILGSIPAGRRKQLFDSMSGNDNRTLHELLNYSEDTAGGIMTTAYIALPYDLTIAETIQKIKQIAPRTEVIETIYVMNGMRQLIGTADLRDILVADNDAHLESIMDNDPISVEPQVDQEVVARLVAKYDLNAIPVVNRRKGMLGIITLDDVIDVINEEHTEDMYSMAGVGKEEGIKTSLTESIKMRLPWLAINLATAFLAAFTIKAFEGTIEKVVALSSMMTIISGMGGNAGTQTLSIMIRSIALGEVRFKDAWKPLLKEIALGVINGAAMGAITGCVAYLMYGNWFLGLITFIAMIGNLIIAGLFGFLIPLILKALHQDPALGATVFLTTATDVLGFFIFLGLATIFLPYLS